jgi:hypothetical protein
MFAIYELKCENDDNSLLESTPLAPLPIPKYSRIKILCSPITSTKQETTDHMVVANEGMLLFRYFS